MEKNIHRDFVFLISFFFIKIKKNKLLKHTKQQTITIKTRRIRPAIAPTNGTQSGKRGILIVSGRLANSAGVVALNIKYYFIFLSNKILFTVALSLSVDV